MSDAAILGNSFMDVATKYNATQEKDVELLNGSKKPIRRGGARKRHPVVSISAVCACPQGRTAHIRPARKIWVKLKTIAPILLMSTYSGHGFVKRRPSLYHKLRLKFAQGPAIMVAGDPLTIQVVHSGATPLRLTKDTTMAYIDLSEEPTDEVSPVELKELRGTTKKKEESPLRGAEVLSVPDKWSAALKALLREHAPLYRGHLGLITV